MENSSRESVDQTSRPPRKRRFDESNDHREGSSDDTRTALCASCQPQTASILPFQQYNGYTSRDISSNFGGGEQSIRGINSDSPLRYPMLSPGTTDYISLPNQPSLYSRYFETLAEHQLDHSMTFERRRYLLGMPINNPNDSMPSLPHQQLQPPAQNSLANAWPSTSGTNDYNLSFLGASALLRAMEDDSFTRNDMLATSNPSTSRQASSLLHAVEENRSMRNNIFAARNPSSLRASSLLRNDMLGTNRPIYRYGFNQDDESPLTSSMMASNAETDAARGIVTNPTNPLDIGNGIQEITAPTSPYSLAETRFKKPPCTEGLPSRHSDRLALPLAVNEESWNSDIFKLVRSELVEVFRASGAHVAARVHNKMIVYLQVGIRCRFCAHLPPDERAARATAFPSSIDKLRQSCSTLMREHIPKCEEIPEEFMLRYNNLKARQATTSNSKQDWRESAAQLGLVDTREGIKFFSDTYSLQRPTGPLVLTAAAAELLVEDSDRSLVSNYLFFLMSQAQRIYVTEGDNRSGQNRLPPVGSAGFGCRHCCNVTIIQGQNRHFPFKVRNLPRKAFLLHEHLLHCSRCPQEIQVSMSLLKRAANGHKMSDSDKENEKAFFSRIWARLKGKIPIGAGIQI